MCVYIHIYSKCVFLLKFLKITFTIIENLKLTISHTESLEAYIKKTIKYNLNNGSDMFSAVNSNPQIIGLYILSGFLTNHV